MRFVGWLRRGNPGVFCLDRSFFFNDTATTEIYTVPTRRSSDLKALGYAVTEVSGDEVNAAKPINPIDALSGKVPGVDISSTTAGPSGSTRVVIRGNGELSGNNQPLYVIDGVPIDNSQMGSASQWEIGR